MEKYARERFERVIYINTLHWRATLNKTTYTSSISAIKLEQI